MFKANYSTSTIQRYSNKLRSSDERDYAKAYWQFITSGRGSAPSHAHLSEIDAKLIRVRLELLKSQQNIKSSASAVRYANALANHRSEQQRKANALAADRKRAIDNRIEQLRGYLAEDLDKEIPESQVPRSLMEEFSLTYEQALTEIDRHDAWEAVNVN